MVDCRNPYAEEIVVLSAIMSPETKAVFISLLSYISQIYVFLL